MTFAAAGAEVLGTLADLLELGKAGEIDGIVFAPLNKAAMRRGGLKEGDELDFALLLDGLAVRSTEGYEAAAPTLTRALHLVLDLNVADQEVGRWLWLVDSTACGIIVR